MLHDHLHAHWLFGGRRGHGHFGGFGGRRGPGAGFFWDSPPGGRPRAERGEVRYLVLDAISEQPRHGYEVIQVIEERSQRAYRPSPGVIYPTLQLLDEMGLARSLDREGRKVYEITDEGRRELEAHRDEVAEFYERSEEDGWPFDAEEIAVLMRSVGKIFRSLRRAARRGRLHSSLATEIAEIVEEAVEKIEKAIGRQERR